MVEKRYIRTGSSPFSRTVPYLATVSIPVPVMKRNSKYKEISPNNHRITEC